MLRSDRSLLRQASMPHPPGLLNGMVREGQFGIIDAHARSRTLRQPASDLKAMVPLHDRTFPQKLLFQRPLALGGSNMDGRPTIESGNLRTFSCDRHLGSRGRDGHRTTQIAEPSSRLLSGQIRQRAASRGGAPVFNSRFPKQERRMAAGEKPLVYLVDDEETIRRSAGFMLRTSGFRVKSYKSGGDFLREAHSLEPGCVLLDIRMPGMDGLEVLRAMRESGSPLPVIIMTGDGEAGFAVDAMRAGAIDFIEKPFAKSDLLSALEVGRSRLQEKTADTSQSDDAHAALRRLTRRELHILKGLAQGLPNGTIADDLGISRRRVEFHRAQLMKKLGTRTLSQTLRAAFAAGLGDQEP